MSTIWKRRVWCSSGSSGKHRQLCRSDNGSTVGLKHRKGGSGASFVPIVCGDGFRLMDVFVVPIGDGESAQATILPCKRGLRGSVPVFYTFNTSGWLDGDCMKLIRPKFLEQHRQTVRGAVDPILLMDNLAAHRTPDLCKWMVNNKVLGAFFPPFCTHFIQPLDDLPLAAFRQKMAQLCQERSVFAAMRGQTLADLLLEAAQEARDSITSATIISAFKATGIKPLNIVLIKKRVNEFINGAEQPTTEAKETLDILTTTIKETLKQAGDTSKTKKVHAPKNRAKLYSADEILGAEEERAAQVETKKLERDEKKANAEARKRATAIDKLRRAGRIPCCGNHMVSKSGDQLPCKDKKKGWRCCQLCSQFALCASCFVADSDAFKSHVAGCAGAQPKAKRQTKSNKWAPAS